MIFGYDCLDEDNMLKYLRLGKGYHINTGIKSG
jgi:hypothetical protein